MLESVQTIVYQVIQEQLSVEASLIAPQSRFIDDLGADSLDMIEVFTAIEDRFQIDITDEEAPTLATVQQLIQCVQRKQDEKDNPA